MPLPSFRLREVGITVQSVGTGSTPTASLPISAMTGLTEIHPGNYIFYGMGTMFLFITDIIGKNELC
jgi:D-serine deaminase-like pyridoxal phosphate-dependent protein